MNEVNPAARAPRKRRSFLWLWILMILAAFTAGIVLGLKLNTLPLPNDVQNRLYPVLEAIIPGSTTARPQQAAPAPVVTPAPAPAETPAPAVETPAPAVETPAPAAETPAPAAMPAALDLPPIPADELTQPEAEPEVEIVESVGPAVSDTARFESAPAKSIGVDAALDAALSYAKVEKKDAEVTGVYRLKDEDGQNVYEVAFKVGEISYEYIVSAADGEILGWKMSGFHVEDLETFGDDVIPPTPAAAETK